MQSDPSFPVVHHMMTHLKQAHQAMQEAQSQLASPYGSTLLMRFLPTMDA